MSFMQFYIEGNSEFDFLKIMYFCNIYVYHKHTSFVYSFLTSFNMKSFTATQELMI